MAQHLHHTNTSVVVAVIELFRCLSICCGDLFYPIADASVVEILILCSHTSQSIASNAQDCMYQYTTRTGYSLETILRAGDKFSKPQGMHVLCAPSSIIRISSMIQDEPNVSIFRHHCLLPRRIQVYVPIHKTSATHSNALVSPHH